MANVNQIYNFLNDTTKEMIGGSPITVKDTSTLVSLGDTILSSDTSTEQFYTKLVDKIGMTYVKYRELTKDALSDILRTPMDFGIILQKVNTSEIARAVENGSWTNQKNPFANGKDTTKITSTLFSKIATWELDKIIYDYQLKTAFKSATEMGAFIQLVFNDMYNGMELALRDCANLCVATSIGDCLASSKNTVKRNLLTEYNSLTNEDLTVASCMRSLNFLKYASREINLVVKRMHDVSTLFNSKGYERFTSDNELNIRMLADFSTACSSYLEADTFHKELVALPHYKEVSYWQGLGERGSFTDVSTIKVTNDTINVEQSGVLAFISDKERHGVMIDKIRTKTMYNPASELTNYFHKADIGMYMDNSEQGIVFYIAES